MYDLTEPLKERYKTEKGKLIEANKQHDKKKLFGSLVSELFTRSGEIVFTVYVIQQALDANITIGNIALYTGFAISASASFQTMSTIAVTAYIRITHNMSRLFDFNKIECPDDNRGVRKLRNFESMTFQDVYFKYPLTEKFVLNGTSFTLNKGDKLSIIGINGSGKSTIIKLMLGLYAIDSGKILINGFPMQDYDIQDVRRLFSALFQSFVQYPLTLRENIALSNLQREDNDVEIIEALKKSGIYENFHKFENGLDSHLTRQFDDDGIELSKGQWQKIALSRAYFKNSSIIIFDEPSAALDAEAEDRIFKNFEAISDGKTGIMISHRISSARMSNKIIVLNNGIIEKIGTHEELLAHNDLYAKLYNLQLNKYTIKEKN